MIGRFFAALVGLLGAFIGCPKSPPPAPPCDCSVVTMDGLPSVAHFDHCPTRQQIEAYEAAHPGGEQFGECRPTRKP